MTVMLLIAWIQVKFECSRLRWVGVERELRGAARGSQLVDLLRQSEQQKKRKRNLMANVEANQANAKSHGINH